MKKKLKVGLYGYRDLKQDELEVALYLLETTLQCLMRKESDRELILVSALSLEIDKKIIKIAQKLGVRYDVILPSKPALCYSSVNYESHREFYGMLLSARGYTIEHDEVLGEKLVDATDVMLCIDNSTTPSDISATIEYSIKSKRDYTIIIDIKKSDGEEGVLIDSYGIGGTSGEWVEVDNNITDQEKFLSITIVFKDIFIEYNSCAKRLGIGHKTVHNWIQQTGKGGIQKPFHRTKICELFGLKESVWDDKFKDVKTFKEALPTYIERVIVNDESTDGLEKTIVGIKINLTGQEEDLIEELSKLKKVIYPIEDMYNKTPIFLFELVKVLTKKEQIEDAFSLLEIIKRGSSSFKYSYHNQMELQRAILLSHEKIKKYDEAIEILNILYSASNYHLVEPEVITLLASNYKRKALSELADDNQWTQREQIDNSLLTSAMKLYYQSYNRRDINKKYYDAINLAYLLKLSKTIEIELDDIDNDIEEIELKRLYKELSLHWRVDESNWWEVCSDAEFLMLLGKSDQAISKINHFFDFKDHNHDSFDIRATLRQLEMYLHFVDDKHGRTFYEYLKESWEILGE